MHNLIQITEQEFNVKLDIRYAGDNNFTGKPIYNQPLCYLHPEALNCLKKTIKLAAEKNYRLKIFDAYRPIEVQQHLFDAYPEGGFISNPKTGSVPHCRGIAIDLTLIDENNQELDMGTEFDNFTDLAFHDSQVISQTAKKNRQILMQIMLDSGWDFYQKEWWHYQLFKPREYQIIHNFKI
jgi:zinc D-Ala-D-Ala dipeptidase